MTERRGPLLAGLIAGMAILLAACSPAAPAESETSAGALASVGGDQLARLDDQGAVSVRIVPLNLSNPGVNLDFAVVLDTHTVELSMDLAQLATLTTDLGVSVESQLWDAPRGGHHVEGVLSFPASTGGRDLLSGASLLRLTLRGLDVPERVFEWALAAD